MNLHLFTVVIVGSGPSLTKEQCDYISKRRADNACRVIVCNDNFRLAPNADILFAADGTWLKYHAKDVIASKIPVYSCDARVRQIVNGTFIPQLAGKGLPKVGEGRVYKCTQSGMMATMLAVEKGATHIVLVGMDAKRGEDGKAHWFGSHPRALPAPQPFNLWAKEWSDIAPYAAERGIRLAQCSLRHDTPTLIQSTLEQELEAECSPT